MLTKYMKCPFTALCTNMIPKVLVCAGRTIPAHKVLFSRPISVAHVMALSGYLHLNMSLAISSLVPAQIVPAAEQTPIAWANTNGKLYCTMKGCTKVAISSSCQAQMCKQHCKSSGGCSYHKSGRAAVVNNSEDPWALSRTPPSIPIQSNPLGPSSAGNGVVSTNPTTLATGTKEYCRKLVPTKQVQQKTIEGKACQNEYQKKYNQQVIIYGWTRDGVEPFLHHDRDIPTWPMYSMANFPKLLHKLGINISDLSKLHTLDVYHANVGLWENEKLDPNLTAGLQIVLSPSRCSSKRTAADMNEGKFDDLDTESPLPKRFASIFPITENFPDATGPVITPLEAVNAPTSLSNIQINTNTPHSNPPSPITTRLSVAHPWPQGWYASDVGQGLEKMDVKRVCGSTQEDHFHLVFPHATWFKPTFQCHKSTWKNSTAQERQQAKSLPRNADGLWIGWYLKASGKQKSS
ncbi:hypothetical protein B0H34DRAFT_678955 [Crassisporium funariophilum]|nr:hypothetical protein B0H34DRAFT_678955 [Crassisporium funariophilum]